MNTQLTQQQIDDYRENGFVIQRDFLSPEEVEDWKNVLQAVIDERGDSLLPGRKEVHEEKAKTAPKDRNTEYYAQVFQQRVNLWQDDARVKERILNPEIGRMATLLEGVEGMRVWHDQALYKAPWANPTAWHLDNPYWSFHSAHAISIWIALDDATLHNGCLYFLPGTHKKQDWTSVPISFNMNAVFETHPEYKGIEPVAAEMKAGDCSFHNGLTVHGAGPNMTPRWRRAMTCGFMPIGSTFNGQQNILSREQVERLEVGQKLDDDEQNPIVWARDMAGAGV